MDADAEEEGREQKILFPQISTKEAIAFSTYPT
jgi:hypothetical protein